MPLNALWMSRSTLPWMGWMSPPAHLQLQVITGIWPSAPSCQIFCWHQMWPNENEARDGCFPDINLVSVSCALSIYCYLGEYQERRWWQTDCCPGAGPGEASGLKKGMEAMREEEKAWEGSFCSSQHQVGCGEKVQPDPSWMRTGCKKHHCNREIPVRCEEIFFFRKLLPPGMNEWYWWWCH